MKKRSGFKGLLFFALCVGTSQHALSQALVDPFDVNTPPPTNPQSLGQPVIPAPSPSFQTNPAPEPVLPATPPKPNPSEVTTPSVEPATTATALDETTTETNPSDDFWDRLTRFLNLDDEPSDIEETIVENDPVSRVEPADRNVQTEEKPLKVIEPAAKPEPQEIVEPEPVIKPQPLANEDATIEPEPVAAIDQIDPFVDLATVPTLPITILQPPQEDTPKSFVERLGGFFSTTNSEPALPSYTYSIEFERVRPIEERLPAPKIELVEKEAVDLGANTPETAESATEVLETITPEDIQAIPQIEIRTPIEPEPRQQLEPIKAIDIVKTEEPPLENLKDVNEPEIKGSLLRSVVPETLSELTTVQTFEPATLPPKEPVNVAELEVKSEPANVPSVTLDIPQTLGDVIQAEDRTMTVGLEEKVIEPLDEARNIPDEDGFFSRLGNLFSSSDEVENPDQPFDIPSLQEEETKPVARTVDIARAKDLTVVIQKPAPPPTDPRLQNAILGLGRDVQLGQSDNDLSRQAKCFTKNRGTVAFCLTPTRWSGEISPYFEVTTHLYLGTKAIVKYDGDIATRLFALFETEGFETIIAYFERQFGPPTGEFKRRTRTIKKGVVENPVYMWRRQNPDDGLYEVVEVRKIADKRGSIPDLQRGSIRVYFEGSRDIFSMTSDLDYMQLR